MDARLRMTAGRRRATPHAGTRSFGVKPDLWRRRIQDWLEIGLRPVAGVLARAGITPNQVSLAGAVLTLVSAGLVLRGALLPAGIIYLAGSLLDLVDGALARLSHRATRFGAFLDSTLDRVSEGLVFAALAYRFAARGEAVEAGLVVLALLGSLLVSYTRARAEALGATCKVGVMTRAERVAIVAAGLVFACLPLAIYLIVALTAFTVLQRIVQASRELRALQ